MPCYLIPTKDGKSSIRIQAVKRPSAREVQALQQLFDHALTRALERQFADKRIAGAKTACSSVPVLQEGTRRNKRL
jgi:hypothetical protein